MPEAFVFPYYFQDLVDKTLRDQPLPEEWRAILSEFSTTSQARDDDVEDFLDQDSFAPALGLVRSANQSINASTWTSITFDSQAFTSTDVLTWDSATKVTAGEAGIVLVTGNILFAASGVGDRLVRLLTNGVTQSSIVTVLPTASGNATGVLISKAFSMAQGDYLELQGFQSTVGALNVTAEFSAVWLGKSG